MSSALIESLSRASPAPICVVINGDFPQGGFDATLRHKFLQGIAAFRNVNPVCIGTGRGMAYLWNTGIRLSCAEKLLVLSDDLDIDEANLASFIAGGFQALEENDLVILNSSFGHFALRRTLIDQVGWFDELLLGFGEEDGDFFWRCASDGRVQISQLALPGLVNMGHATGYEDVIRGTGKYSLVNRVAMFTQLYRPDAEGVRGMFSTPHKRRHQVPNYYPGESAWRALRHLVDSASPDEIESSYSAWLSSQAD